ncbi:hybrid sensor histidine kinase/response regulator [Gemmatimonas groenlandica]|uniref:histidine kinase n=1 Tax=Gemmatimonas groenlandica TaxID=2732249 RepID=A0A6M4IKU7_9BACT|nr:ATP-binding protein [Gemmatimonas groenlandica]QJR34147.1 PAS domain S-box protein [Gemmatimonas groenlandica]
MNNGRTLRRRLAEADATIAALVSGEIDAVVDSRSRSPVLLAMAQQALRESEARYRSIVETSNEGIFTVALDATLTFANRRIADLLGYTPADLIGRSLLELLPAHAYERAMLRISSLDHDVDGASEVTILKKDGTELHVELKSSVVRDEHGKHVGMLAMMTDRTRRRQAEEALRKIEAQLIVSDRMASVGTLAAGVAHEINNPLAAVTANLAFIAEHCRCGGALSPTADGCEVSGQPSMQDAIKDAREAAERVRIIVRDLMIFSRARPDELIGAVDVHRVLDSTVRMAWNEIRHRAQLVRNYGSVPLVSASEARLGQVMLNLLVNAAQALPEGHAEHHAISLSTWFDRDRQRVMVEIRDTGVGISPEHINRIFDPFFTTKDVGLGTGLGLAICQRIVTDLDGELTVRSELGTGTTFSVSLPIATMPSVVKPLPVPANERGARARILIVDDEELIVRSLVRTLGGEHDVVGVTAAREALALLEAGDRFDVILCDIMMPEMTGVDLYGELMRMAPDQAHRMMFLTGGAFTPSTQAFLAESSNLQLEKPYAPIQLRDAVQLVLRDGRSPANPSPEC